MFDTHCHLDSPRFDADRDEVLARARAAGVTDLVVASIGPDTWEPLRAWAAGRPGIHVALGIHPQLLPELDPAQDRAHLDRLEALLEAGGAVGVGECGLDGATAAHPRAPMDRQVAVLRRHLELARRFALPVSLHCLRAHEPMLALLAQEKLPAGGVLHSYSGSAEQVRDYLPFGLHFAAAGPVTWERAKKPVLAARAVPRDRLVLETDAPDQTPRPHQGRCEPAFLVEVARGVAAALGCSFEEVARLTDRNAREVFGLARRSS